MSNPNKAYFDKYIDPVVREIDRVNIYEFERGMDYELIQEGGIVDPETIKKAQGKVLKNLKKDPAYYTNQLVEDSVKLVGEYGSGKKPGRRDTPQESEKIKKDGKMPKAGKSSAPFDVKEDNKMKPLKTDKKFSHTKGSLKEGMDYGISNQDTSDDPAAYGHGTMRSFEAIEFEDEEERYDNYKDARVAKKARDWYFTNHDEEEFDPRTGENPYTNYLDKAPYELDEMSDDPDQAILNRLKGHMKDVTKPKKPSPKNEMINVKDSRKFYITRESADMLKKMVSEAIAMVTTRGGTKAVDYKNDSELADLRADSNVTSIEKSSGQKVK